MTLEEAKFADVILEYIASRTVVYRKEFNEKFDNEYEYSDLKKYVSLLISDNLIDDPISIQDTIENNDKKLLLSSFFKVTPYGKSFYYFKGGYTKMVLNKIKEKRSKKRKEYFEISKDVLLILLSLLSIYIGIS